MHNLLKVAIVSTVAFSTVATAASAVSQAETTTATVKSNTTLYKAANKKKKLKAVKKSSKVTIVRKGGTWTKVKYAGKTGYMLTKYLKFVSTEAQLENTAIAKGKDLLKKVTALDKIAEAGNITGLYDGTYDDLSTAANTYADYVDNIKVSKEVKTKLKAQYTNVALNTLECYSKEIDTWRYIVQTQGRIKNFKYDTAQKSYDAAVTAFAEGQALRTEKGYAALPPKLEKTLKAQIDLLNERFSTSTYEQLETEGHIGISNNDEITFENISSTNPFKALDGKTYTNGFKTLSNDWYKYSFKTIQFPAGTFKRVTLTVTLGDYWNKNDFDGTAEVIIGGEVYTFSNGDDAINIEYDLSDTTTKFELKKDTKISNIAFTNIVFYR